MENAKKIFVGATLLLTLIAGINYALAHRHIRHAISSDPRNEGITALAYQQRFVNPGVIVIDLWGVSGERSMLDVSRVLFSFASRIKNRELDRVVLAYRGRHKFYLEGSDFNTIGIKYGAQNPIYTLRTLPENVKRLDGSPAFDTWTGGWIGVMRHQMDDLHTFHRQWWLDSAVRRQLGDRQTR